MVSYQKKPPTCPLLSCGMLTSPGISDSKSIAEPLFAKDRRANIGRSFRWKIYLRVVTLKSASPYRYDRPAADFHGQQYIQYNPVPDVLTKTGATFKTSFTVSDGSRGSFQYKRATFTIIDMRMRLPIRPHEAFNIPSRLLRRGVSKVGSCFFCMVFTARPLTRDSNAGGFPFAAEETRCQQCHPPSHSQLHCYIK